jgi:hypothetical protein
LIRQGAERNLLLVIISFTVAVVGTRWFLDLTGYPQVGGGELHIAHMLWGGLALVVAALVLLVVDAPWAPPAAAIATGAGTGLFIDEVGKFITASNDYFYPLAAPLIYGLFLVLALVFLLVRHRKGGEAAVVAPSRVSGWEQRHLPQRRYRRLLVLFLGLTGTGWLLGLLIYIALDSALIQQAIAELTSARTGRRAAPRGRGVPRAQPRRARGAGRSHWPGGGAHGRSAGEPVRGADHRCQLDDHPSRAAAGGDPLPQPVPRRSCHRLTPALSAQAAALSDVRRPVR